jgi:ferrous iron transport protein A
VLGAAVIENGFLFLDFAVRWAKLLATHLLQEATMENVVNLRNLGVGDSGRIAAVEVAGEMGRRIRDMGLIPGTQVKVVGRAPLQDPVALRLSGVTITLRNNEADYIRIVR